jgi:acyl-coenzyme A thioesterase PaaI-like protein
MKVLPGLPQCFVCGDKNEHGLKLKFAVAEDGESVVCEYVPPEHFGGYPPYAHGGVISAMFDEGCGWPIIYRIGFACMTVQLNVTFKRPATIGMKLRLVAKEVPSDSKRSFKSAGTLTDETGTVIATAEAIYVPLDASFSSVFFQTLSFEGAGITASHFDERRVAAAGAVGK